MIKLYIKQTFLIFKLPFFNYTHFTYYFCSNQYLQSDKNFRAICGPHYRGQKELFIYNNFKYITVILFRSGLNKTNILINKILISLSYSCFTNISEILQITRGSKVSHNFILVIKSVNESRQ